MTRVLVLNGPNLNLLGTREPQIYGSTTLSDIITNLQTKAASFPATIESFQSNHEGAIVDRIHDRSRKIDAIIINPGAFTHTSVAIRDAFV
ncbi:dehydroquinase class II [Pochonia chlamydosporia 170]|uniref:Catabolic 3-dehydroquinase n=1 Tax=Pochonia chlamydosporia 170 TaxID=1380566 RepID=A0A179F2N8_METCM|nr:dehydroquinase class II [Pochonia chlamydosporia 170]OAQ59600.2 dehydroquinase class II [Pochonia chlamydosporia 170]